MTMASKLREQALKCDAAKSMEMGRLFHRTAL
ncbi:hypothetical protein Pla175_42610 [Pirellulimonas nuda]|uniref:Uncharacterized protein n=1 Tax=Pirellulimonas nuda TaxID=2528009 RepID=A0A518DH93_9BACT|nr:hypothetical protein Pla175_42610 [Pirellulimonas nuda]